VIGAAGSDENDVFGGFVVAAGIESVAGLESDGAVPSVVIGGVGDEDG
jgi:hypothetical protein